jgi:hypothetical protein
MRILKSLGTVVCGLTALVLMATAIPMHAQGPNYLGALSSLRTARDYINSDHRPQFDGPRRHAVDEINKAIQEIKNAAWDDGVQTKYAPPAAGVTDPWMPMKAAADWLAEALKQLDYGTDPNPANVNVQPRATQHINEARHTVGRIYQMAGH